MRNIIMQLNLKSMLIIAAWSIICTASIVVILIVSHDRATETIKDRLDFIELQLDVRTTDRYHGADARRDFGDIRRQLEEIRNDCDCERKKM
jgi:hypothetical protein